MDRGDVVGERFALQQLVAGGGMGAVYRALDRSTGQPVAVKVLRAPRGSSAARFERETRILSAIDHPLVVRYVAHGALPSGVPYLVMEWLDGEDLSSRLARERLHAADSLALAIAVAEALGVLHDRGIVHRHLKPSNIFLVQGHVDRIKILDFRLARIEDCMRMTATGELLGTVSYMAPEQARGARDLDARADVFALGCVLFECLTAERAFSAASRVAILTKILFQEAPPLCDALPGSPPALEALVARLLSKQPDDRPRNGREAGGALRALQERGLPLAEPASANSLMAGEQRTVAVILVDATGDDTAVERVGIDEGLELAAAAHGGRIEQLMDGSTAVLLSGVEVATDLAAQAARCALAMARHAPGRRITLAVGRSEPLGRLAVGSAADRAARLLTGEHAQGHERPQALLTLDETAAGLLDARFDVRDEGGVFVLRAEHDVAEVRPLLGKLTPYVGRERDLQLLEELFDECARERVAEAVLITARAGMGKSRLAREFLQHIRTRDVGAAVWIGRGDLLRAGSAFGLLRQVLRGACDMREGEPLEARREKIRARVAERIAESERKRVTEFLGELAGAPFPAGDSLPLRAARTDAQLMNDQMRAAFVDFLAAECDHNPVAIVLEDMHWGDLPSVQFLDSALRQLRARPLFILALARPEVHEIFPRLWPERALQEIRLAGLSRRAIGRLVRHVLGDDTSPETIERLAQLSDGNAFYLEELIRSSAERQEGQLPETLVAMVQSRLGALDDPSRRLLRAASVFGEVFWRGSVAALLGSAERRIPLRDRLAGLVDRELLVRRQESRFGGEEEYAFRHALLREGAYAMLTDQDRTLGHRLAGEWLEAHGEQDALLLAEHFEKGADPERAGRHYLRAAEQANAGGDSTDAVTYARRGIACGVSDELHIALLGMLCETQFFRLDLVATVLPHAQELVRVAPQASAPWVQGMFIVLVCSLQEGRFEDFLAAFRSLLEIDPSVDTADILCLALAVGIYQLSFLGRIQDTRTALDRLAAMANVFGDSRPLVPYFWHIISAYATAPTTDNPEAGLSHSEAAVAIADEAGHRRYAHFGRVIAGMNRWLLGASAEAERTLKESTMPDEELGYATSTRPFSLAWLLADRGAFSEAREWAERLVTSGQARRLPVDEGRGRWVLAEVLRRSGELEAAEAQIQAALPMLESATALDVPGALATLAALRLSQGKPSEALAAAEEGFARYTAMGACSLFSRGAFLRLIHAECLRAATNPHAAAAAIAGAKQRLFSIADKITNPEYRRSFLEDVPENRRTLELADRWLARHD